MRVNPEDFIPERLQPPDEAAFVFVDEPLLQDFILSFAPTMLPCGYNLFEPSALLRRTIRRHHQTVISRRLELDHRLRQLPPAEVFVAFVGGDQPLRKSGCSAKKASNASAASPLRPAT